MVGLLTVELPFSYGLFLLGRRNDKHMADPGAGLFFTGTLLFSGNGEMYSVLIYRVRETSYLNFMVLIFLNIDLLSVQAIEFIQLFDSLTKGFRSSSSVIV